MAYTKKTAKTNEAFQKLKADLSAGTPGCAYIFYGEESYLREYYLGELRKKLVPAGFEEFNYHRLSGKGLTVQELAEAGLAVVITTQCMYEGVDLSVYEVGQNMSASNVILGGTMTTEALTMKLMWALAHFEDLEKVKEFME